MATKKDELSVVACLKLCGVPFQHWHLTAFHNLLAEVGHIVRMVPVFDNDNFETVRVLVACYNPENIPKSLQMTCISRKAIVHIDMEGWLDSILIPYLPEIPDEVDEPLFPSPSDEPANHQQPTTQNTPSWVQQWVTAM